MISKAQNQMFKGLMLLIGLLGISLSSLAAKRYIVTLDSPMTYQALKFAKMGSPIKSGAFQMLSQQGAKVDELFDNLQMAVVESSSLEAISSLKGKMGIADIEEEIVIPAPKSLKGTDLLKGTEVEEVGMPWGIEAVRAPEAWEQGHTGKGVRVLVLDTGIDKDHPNLKNRFEKGKNFANVDLPNAPYPYFDNIAHGTHVAGTIAGDGVLTGLYGVAPEAKILSARVCSELGCTTTSILGGVNWGIQEKVDVMNLSLGGPMASRAAERAYQAATNAGIAVVCASGNDGNGSVSYPGAYPSTIAVGAVNDKIEKADFSQWGPELDVMAPGVSVLSSVPMGTGKATYVFVDRGNGREKLESLPVAGSSVAENAVTGDLVYIGLGKPEDVSGLDLRDKVALVRRGEINFGEKVANAIRAKASAVIIFNNEPGVLSATLGEGVQVGIPVVFITQADGESIVGNNATVVGMVQTRASDFEKMNGTSMATPHVAGIAALIKSVNKSITGTDVKRILKSTAHAMTPNDQNQTGSGMVDAMDAVLAAESQSNVLLQVSGL